MTLLKYTIYLSPDVALTVEAAKVNTGEFRLWFFDEDNNLVALFQWAEILGFTVEGSAHGQVLTDKIPLEMGKVPEDELGLRGRLHLESVRQHLERLSEPEIPF